MPCICTIIILCLYLSLILIAYVYPHMGVIIMLAIQHFGHRCTIIFIIVYPVRAEIACVIIYMMDAVAMPLLCMSWVCVLACMYFPLICVYRVQFLQIYRHKVNTPSVVNTHQLIEKPLIPFALIHVQCN